VVHPEKLPKYSEIRWRFEQRGEQLMGKSAIGTEFVISDIFFLRNGPGNRIDLS
jgi:hypothetical protein